MNCLKIDIELAKRPEVSVKGGNDLSVKVGIVRKKIRNCVKAVLNRINNIFVATAVVNDVFSVNTSYACSKPKIDLGIVCMTNLNTECYLKVLDGYLITMDGCYMKVVRG